MEEHDKIKKLASSENHEASVDPVELKGKDGGKIGTITQFEFYPNKDFYNLTKEVQIEIAMEELNRVLYKHCDDIGWYPCQSPEISLDKATGIYRIIAYLQRGTGRNAKFASELKAEGTIGINEK